MSRHFDDILRAISQEVSTTSSTDFFPAFLHQLVEVFDVEYGLIGRIAKNDSSRVDSVATCSRSRELPAFSYELPGSPCESLAACKKTHCFKSGIRQLFPDNRHLASLEAESYIGSPLFNSTGELIGFLVLIDTRPLDNTKNIEAIFDLFSARCASELELQEKNLQLRQIFKATEYSPSSIIITDKEGRIEYVNPKFTDLTGYSLDEVRGKNPRILSNPRLRPDAKTLWATLRAGREWCGTFHNLKKDGSPYLERACISPIFDENNKITHYVAVKEDVTSLKQSEEEFRRSEIRFRNLLDQMVDSIILFNPQGAIVDVNLKACSSLGYSREELLCMNVRQLDPDNTLYCAQPFWAGLPSGMAITVRGQHQKKSGQTFPVEIRLGVFDDEKNRCVLALARDISGRIEAEQEMKHQKDLLQNILDNIPHSVFWKNRDFKYLGCNRNFAMAAGFETPEDVIGLTDFDLPWQPHEAEFYRRSDQKVLETGTPLLNYEHTRRQADGRVADILASKVPLVDEAGSVSGVLSFQADITDMKKTKEALDRMANYDSLTGLPNKTLFQDRLSQSLGRARRKQEVLAVLSLDIDHFERVNTALGHGGGDLTLKEISRRIVSLLRSDDTVAKMGGDSFAILLPGLTSINDASLVAAKILSAMKAPFVHEGTELFISATIGIALYPGDGENVEELLKNSTIALNRAKASGRNTYLLFTQGMNEKAMERITLENNLRKAIQKGEFLLNYQPQIDATRNMLVGAEALVRWHHGEQGIISPVRFIPLAEETGLIVPLGEWVLEEACRQIRQWKDEGLHFGKISVNIAAQQLMETDLPALVARLLAQYDISPALLGLEITESSIMKDIDKAIGILTTLKNMGLHLSIDDFGTGYSSLSYLKKFPIDVLKIDRSFVMDLPGNKDDGAIVSAIIALSHNLGLSVLAEGVETAEQLHYLMERNCLDIQGYFYSPPLKAPDFKEFCLQGLARAQAG